VLTVSLLFPGCLQSVLEFWYRAAFSSALPPEYVRLQGALRLYRRVAPKGELTRSKARSDPANVGLDAAYGAWPALCFRYTIAIASMLPHHAEATNREIIPGNVTYWYFHAQTSQGYRPRYFPRIVNTSPRILYAPLEAVFLGEDVGHLQPLVPVDSSPTTAP
jgi:hypothetical protein